jgi:hypothetical protein
MQNTKRVTITDREIKPQVMRKRIGSATFEVEIYFSERSTETAEDKVFRLIRQEVQK